MLGIILAGGMLSPYNLIIGFSVIVILSFFFGEVSKKTNVPSVLMLILLGIVLNLVLGSVAPEISEIINGDDEESTIKKALNITLKLIGTVGLIMIVLEAALELELKREKLIPILKAFLIAFGGLFLSIWIAAEVLEFYFPEMDRATAWIYATPLSILSSAIIIPSVTGLNESKKEFHIYESTFSDILGIMVFYYLTDQIDAAQDTSGFAGFSLKVVATIIISFIASYSIVIIFQNIKSHAKLFLLIAVLLLLYAVGKKFHLSPLLLVLIFGLVISNMGLFFKGPIGKWLNHKKAEEIYEGLHVITLETAFVVRTFFFVIFGITIVLSKLASLKVALISALILISIYVIRYVLLRIFTGKDIMPQTFIASRGLITVLLFYDIPKGVKVASFEEGILLYVIIITGIVMTFAMIYDKRRTGKAVGKAKSSPVGYEVWKAPTIESVSEPKEEGH